MRQILPGQIGRALPRAAIALAAALACSAALAQAPAAKTRSDAEARALLMANSQCWSGAAAYHGVDVWLLYSIAYVESGYNPNATNRNTNGSYDLGMMQINTIHLPRLSKWGIRPQDLLDPCNSIYLGAWILSENFRRYGYTWRAIGAYNSGNPEIGLKYARKVYAVHRQLTGLDATLPHAAPGAPAAPSLAPGHPQYQQYQGVAQAQGAQPAQYASQYQAQLGAAPQQVSLPTAAEANRASLRR